jgi:hypothetical protein
VKFEIPLVDASNVFQAGHRIRLDLVAVTRGEEATVTVHRGGPRASYVLLPVVPARCQLGVAVDGGAVPTCAADYGPAVP